MTQGTLPVWLSCSQRLASACWMLGLFMGSGSSSERRKLTAPMETFGPDARLQGEAGVREAQAGDPPPNHTSTPSRPLALRGHKSMESRSNRCTWGVVPTLPGAPVPCPVPPSERAQR